MVRIEHDGDDVLIRVKAVPGSSRDEIAGAVGDRLKVRVSVPAQAGKANDAICALLARALGVRARNVTVESGHTSRQKTIRMRGVSLDDVKAAVGRK